MKVLCTGGSGFIGTHLIDRLLSRGEEIINKREKKNNKGATPSPI
jgi:nucleoside-diphosphate-sugar epimerase